MLHDSQQDHVSCANKFSAPRLSDKVDTLGRSASENDFVRAHGADVIRYALARFFVSFRCARAQCVQAAMNIRVLMLIKIPKCFDHRARLLRSRSAIEINQRMLMRLLAQDREMLTDGLPIDGA